MKINKKTIISLKRIKKLKKIIIPKKLKKQKKIIKRKKLKKMRKKKIVKMKIKIKIIWIIQK